MSNDIRNIEPKAVWKNFADLNAVPRASKKEERVIAFIVNFGKKLGLETIIDTVQNVIIKKPATKGMENRKKIVMQSHLDMVHQKNNDTVFDFDNEGIKMYIDGDWVRAEGTTLGADNGLGVASIMAILESNDIQHPAIEALFTIDEETGMTGAMGLEAGYLTGDILLNLDTEDDDEIGVGCAGGVDVTATKKYVIESISKNSSAFKITVKGLQGGHSGMDIIKGLGNANKLMNRILFAISDTIQISEIDGGSLRNAIPRESNAIIATQDEKGLKVAFEKISKEIHNEFDSIEKELKILISKTETPNSALSKSDQKTLINTIYGAHNGVFRMSPDIEDLVETSNNIARVIVKDGVIKIGCLTRSSVESGKWNMANTLKSVFELGGFNVEFSGSYPGWKPNPNSAILKVMSNLYEKMFNEKPNILACHAGLECGLLGTHYPEMDMISFGPTIKGAHSPDERASISSTQKYWKFLLETLKNIPEKN
ncbi:aminoacyl-histidine dipeptidase [Urechidicola croceus]|uniref:Cytosol non-specific dipeptidase n=1 Tax=Urechidicola croceus TaxID=1850246 RepID=A0A1D8P6M6_9FLAO|nr:aminoacyl-histidine dipeptidase [Urechidicola croceus]AOW20212.1 cytosol nonspecific dipeptidase [Urechidicola croceus]